MVTEAVERDAAAVGWKNFMSTVRPEANRAMGGLGSMARKAIQVASPERDEGGCNVGFKLGRAAIHIVDIGHGAQILIAVIYGKTGGDGSQEARDVIEEVIAEVVQVMRDHEHMYCVTTHVYWDHEQEGRHDARGVIP